MSKKAWVTSIDMGYGHQRTAYTLKGIAEKGKIITANNYKGIPQRDKKLWKDSRAFYEAISRFKNVPLIGDFAFSVYDNCQRIMNFYPRRDLSDTNIFQKAIYDLLHKNWGRHFIRKLSKKNIPMVTTFFNIAFMAEYFNYPNDIYCVICDTDIARAWAPIDSKQTRIKYLASTPRSAERLHLYGVKKKNIFLTGFPLPEENAKHTKKDLKTRLVNLDPQKKYYKKYKALVDDKLGKLPLESDHPLTILYSVGGAGAQAEIAIKIVKSLLRELENGEVRIILSAGIRKEVYDCFYKRVGYIKNVEIIYDKEFDGYFDKFNKALRKTDILWTKPSELSFYSWLAIPIIIAPEIGSQEKFNKRWIIKSGFGIEQKDPNHVKDWLFDWLKSGYLAEMAMQGYIEGNRNGLKRIKKIIEK
jgi:hypothetical protein